MKKIKTGGFIVGVLLWGCFSASNTWGISEEIDIVDKNFTAKKLNDVFDRVLRAGKTTRGTRKTLRYILTETHDLPPIKPWSPGGKKLPTEVRLVLRGSEPLIESLYVTAVQRAPGSAKKWVFGEILLIEKTSLGGPLVQGKLRDVHHGNIAPYIGSPARAFLRCFQRMLVVVAKKAGR